VNASTFEKSVKVSHASNVGQCPDVRKEGGSPAEVRRDSGASRIAKVHIGRRERRTTRGRRLDKCLRSGVRSGACHRSNYRHPVSYAKGDFPGNPKFRYVRRPVACLSEKPGAGSFTKHLRMDSGGHVQKKAIPSAL